MQIDRKKTEKCAAFIHLILTEWCQISYYVTHLLFFCVCFFVVFFYFEKFENSEFSTTYVLPYYLQAEWSKAQRTEFQFG